MDPAILAGLVIIAVTMLSVWLLYVLVIGIVRFQIDLREYIFHSNGAMGWRILLWFLWFPLFLFTGIILIIGAICGVSLIKDGYQWLNKD